MPVCDRNHRRTIRRHDKAVNHVSLDLAPPGKARPVDGGEPHAFAVALHPKILRRAKRQLHGAFQRRRVDLGDLHDHLVLLGNGRSTDQNMAGGELRQIVENHDIGPSPGGDQAEIIALKACCRIEGRRLQCPLRPKAVAHQPAHHIVQPAAVQQIVGEDVVGAKRQRRRQMAEPVQGLDKFRQQMIVGAAQFDGQPGAQLRHQVVR